MIIVSQDKSKITQRLEFYIQENFSTDEELKYEIRSIGGGSFGGYETEERAKEILQEILNKYRQYNLDNDKAVTLLPKVFEMPEK